MPTAVYNRSDYYARREAFRGKCPAVCCPGTANFRINCVTARSHAIHMHSPTGANDVLSGNVSPRVNIYVYRYITSAVVATFAYPFPLTSGTLADRRVSETSDIKTVITRADNYSAVAHDPQRKPIAPCASKGCLYSRKIIKKKKNSKVNLP